MEPRAETRIDLDRAGGRFRRVSKIAAAALERLEPTESIREVVQTQIGAPALANWGSGGPGTTVQPCALIATDRNLYAIRLTGATLTTAGDVERKVALSEADLARDRDAVVFGGTRFNIMLGFGRRADRLLCYVAASRGGSAPHP